MECLCVMGDVSGQRAQFLRYEADPQSPHRQPSLSQNLSKSLYAIRWAKM